MKYYKVRPQFGNQPRTRFARSGRQITDGYWRANELFTYVELRAFYPYPLEFPSIFDIIEAPKSNVFHYLGHRFLENKENQ